MKVGGRPERILTPLKLIQLQRADGSWANANARWFEKEPALVTCYALLSLELLWRNLDA